MKASALFIMLDDLRKWIIVRLVLLSFSSNKPDTDGKIRLVRQRTGIFSCSVAAFAGSLLFCSFQLFSQGNQLPMRQFSVVNGLITNNVYSVFKDSNGLLWFGTDNGVLQYDGTEFVSFSTADGIPDNEVFNFCEDASGRIWFSTFNGKLGYYFQGKLYNALNTKFLEIGSHESYINLIENQKDSSTLISFYGSNVVLEIKGDVLVKQVLQYDQTEFSSIQYITKIGDQEYYAITISHELFFRGGKLSFARRLPGANRVFFANKNYLLRGDSLFTIIQGSLEFASVVKNSSIVYNTFYYEKGLGVLGGAQNGLYDCAESGTFHFKHILSDCSVSGINKDSEGNFWFTTLNKGVFFLPKGYDQVQYAKYPDISKINTLKSIDNQLFLYTEDAKVYNTDPITGRTSLFLDYSDIVADLGKQTRRSVFQNSTEIIFGGNCIYEYRQPLGFKKLIFKKGFYSKDLQISGDTIFSNKNDAVNLILRRDPVLLHQPIFPDDRSRIFDITYHQKKLWVSTLKTIYTLQNGRLIKHPSFNNVACKKINFYNNTLVGITHDYKLIVAMPEKDAAGGYEIQRFEGDVFWMDMNYVFNQRVLLRSDRGYYILNLSGEKASLIPAENVLLPKFPQEIVCDSPFVYFLSVDNEITKIHHALIKADQPPPILLIKSFTASNNYINFNNSFSLSYEDAKSIEILFVGIGFARKKILYQYRLNNGSWIAVDKNTLNLLNMAPGDYNLGIRCRSESSEFSADKSITFTILPPWYGHWAFRLLILAVVLTIGYFLLRNVIKKRENAKELKYQQELKFVESEFKSLNALMNPHFIFNSLNNIQYLVNDEKTLEANQYLGIFSKLIRQNMENISKNMISLDKELNLVRNYLELEKLRFGEAIQYQISIERALDIV